MPFSVSGLCRSIATLDLDIEVQIPERAEIIATRTRKLIADARSLHSTYFGNFSAKSLNVLMDRSA